MCCFHDEVIKWKHFPRHLTLCAGNSPVTAEFPTQRPVTRSLGVFFQMCLNKRVNNKRVNNREACELGGHRAHCDITVMNQINAEAILQQFTRYLSQFSTSSNWVTGTLRHITAMRVTKYQVDKTWSCRVQGIYLTCFRNEALSVTDRARYGNPIRAIENKWKYIVMFL